MSCFYILRTPWPVACLKAEAESVCTAAACLRMDAHIRVHVYASGSAWLALLFQPGVSKFWFPLGPPRNWKQRLSLEVCLVCVCVLSACVRVYMCSEACSLCFCTSSLCTYAFIYQDISACPFAKTSYVYAHACVLPTCRSSETSQRAWWMNKIRALGVSSIFASHAELEAWPEAVQVSGYL